MRGLARFTETLSYSLIALIIFGNLIYAYQCIFQTRKYIEKYGFGEGSAIMTRLVGTFAAGFEELKASRDMLWSEALNPANSLQGVG